MLRWGMIKLAWSTDMLILSLEPGKKQFRASKFASFIRNPWGTLEWKGAWATNSKEWTDEAKQKFQQNLTDTNDGNFWMDYDNYVKYFSVVEISKIGSPDYSKAIKIPSDRLEAGNVFELKIIKKTIIDISAVKKYYRFYRKIPNNAGWTVHVLVFKKEGNSFNYVNASSEFEGDSCAADLSLDQGNYIVYVKGVSNYQTFDKKRKYSLFLSADAHFEIVDNGIDQNYELLAIAPVQEIPKEKKDQIKDNEFNIVESDFKIFNLSYIYFNNKTGGSQKVSYEDQTTKYNILYPSFVKIGAKMDLIVPSKTELIIIAERFCPYINCQFTYLYSYGDCDENDPQFVKRGDVSQYVTYPPKKLFPSDFDWIYKNQNYDLSDIIKAAIEKMEPVQEQEIQDAGEEGGEAEN